MLLDRSTESTPWTLHLSLESLTFTLCRLPQVHAFIMTPPALIGEGTVSEKVLDQALMESEVRTCFHDTTIIGSYEMLCSVIDLTAVYAEM